MFKNAVEGPEQPGVAERALSDAPVDELAESATRRRRKFDTDCDRLTAMLARDLLVSFVEWKTWGVAVNNRGETRVSPAETHSAGLPASWC